MAGTAILAVTALTASTHAAPPDRPLGACTVEAIQPMLAPNVHIESIALEATADMQSSYCHVAGYIEDGSPIGFVLGLPAKWNGKFLFIGVGGFGGVPGNIDAGLLRGYATASTDTGHKGNWVDDGSWALNNEPVVVNHFQRAVPLSVAVSKAITAAYYGRKPRYSYFDGCSGGGRQGLLEAQKFPEHFDGIMAGAPAWNYTKLLMTHVEHTSYLLTHPTGWIPPEKFAVIDAEVLRQCDMADGLKDGMLADPRQCQPNLNKLRCRPSASGTVCFTADQVAALEYFSRPQSTVDIKAGMASFPLTGSDSDAYGYGMPAWKFGLKPPVREADGRFHFDAEAKPLQFLGVDFLRHIVHNDTNYDYRRFKIAKHGEQLEREMAPLTNADHTDIGPFVRRGGKLMLWHGWSDHAVPAEMSIDLYGRIRRDTRETGGQPLDQSVRLFMVPGLQHCQWGTGLTEFDRISALERWVEQGEAPDQMLGKQLERGAVKRSRPICAYPKVARYRGVGDPDDATNFECAGP
jgi:feruloyl esterase